MAHPDQLPLDLRGGGIAGVRLGSSEPEGDTFGPLFKEFVRSLLECIVLSTNAEVLYKEKNTPTAEQLFSNCYCYYALGLMRSKCALGNACVPHSHAQDCFCVPPLVQMGLTMELFYKLIHPAL